MDWMEQTHWQAAAAAVAAAAAAGCVIQILHRCIWTIHRSSSQLKEQREAKVFIMDKRLQVG